MRFSFRSVHRAGTPTGWKTWPDIPASRSAVPATFCQRSARAAAEAKDLPELLGAEGVRELNVILSVVGFDTYRGFYHQPRYGRPALTLDMMEPFRPLITDSVALTAINNGEVKPGDFVYAGRARALAPSGRRKDGLVVAKLLRLGQGAGAAIDAAVDAAPLDGVGRFRIDTAPR